jgi:multiple sugar transport system substrate-binding protein
MQVRAVLLAAALTLTPFTARAADLVVWEIAGKIEAALAAGRPPDLLRASESSMHAERWAAAGALADLSDVVLPIKDRFLPGVLEQAFLLSPHTGRPAPFTAPLGQSFIHLHVWTSLLERAGFTLEDIPKEWEPFWSFWCDTVQPAVRRVTGRDDVWGLGLAMSSAAGDTSDTLTQFMIARSASFSPSADRPLVDDPTFRPNLIRALADYTVPWSKGCVPPNAVRWINPDNNKAFLDHQVVLVVNTSLSIPAALRATRPEDYYKATATIGWPAGPDGRIYPLLFIVVEGVVFTGARNVEEGKDFLRFILEQKRLGAWLEGAQGRYLPTMFELVGSPFWMDPADQHRRSAVEELVGPTMPNLGPVRASLPLWWDQAARQRLFGGAVQRIAVDGLTPEQAADELIARLKQLQSE